MQLVMTGQPPNEARDEKFQVARTSRGTFSYVFKHTFYPVSQFCETNATRDADHSLPEAYSRVPGTMKNLKDMQTPSFPLLSPEPLGLCSLYHPQSLSTAFTAH